MNKNSLNSSTLFTSREVIEIQSKLYYPKNDNLGFFTIANSLNEYVEAVTYYIASLKETYTKRHLKTPEYLKIIELGPGTGAFAKKCIQLLDQLNIAVDYSFVDLNPKLFDTAEKLGIKFYQQSFEFFAKNFNQKYDVLICNEALDMWPGQHLLLKNRNASYQVAWQLKNFDTDHIYTKTNLNDTLHIDGSYWEKHCLTMNNEQIVPITKDLYTESVLLPRALRHLVSLSRIGGIIQDYWSFEEENPLRIGFTQKDCLEFIHKYSSKKHLLTYVNFFKKMLTTQSSGELFDEIDENEKILLSTIPTMKFMKYWFESPLIPYGSVDITYSPNAIELRETLSKLQYKVEMVPLDEMIKRFITVESSELYDVAVENESVLLFERIR